MKQLPCGTTFPSTVQFDACIKRNLLQYDLFNFNRLYFNVYATIAQSVKWMATGLTTEGLNPISNRGFLLSMCRPSAITGRTCRHELLHSSPSCVVREKGWSVFSNFIRLRLSWEGDVSSAGHWMFYICRVRRNIDLVTFQLLTAKSVKSGADVVCVVW